MDGKIEKLKLKIIRRKNLKKKKEDETAEFLKERRLMNATRSFYLCEVGILQKELDLYKPIFDKFLCIECYKSHMDDRVDFDNLDYSYIKKDLVCRHKTVPNENMCTIHSFKLSYNDVYGAFIDRFCSRGCPTLKDIIDNPPWQSKRSCVIDHPNGVKEFIEIEGFGNKKL